MASPKLHMKADGSGRDSYIVRDSHYVLGMEVQPRHCESRWADNLRLHAGRDEIYPPCCSSTICSRASSLAPNSSPSSLAASRPLSATSAARVQKFLQRDGRLAAAAMKLQRHPEARGLPSSRSSTSVLSTTAGSTTSGGSAHAPIRPPVPWARQSGKRGDKMSSPAGARDRAARKRSSRPASATEARALARKLDIENKAFAKEHARSEYTSDASIASGAKGADFIATKTKGPKIASLQRPQRALAVLPRCQPAQLRRSASVGATRGGRRPT